MVQYWVKFLVLSALSGYEFSSLCIIYRRVQWKERALLTLQVRGSNPALFENTELPAKIRDGDAKEGEQKCNQFCVTKLLVYLAGTLAKVIKGLRQLTNLPPLSSIQDISTVQVYRCSMWLCTDSQSREEGESGSIPLFSASLLKYYTKHKTHLTRERDYFPG